MKNVTKLIGIIALVAVIGFSFSACGNNNNGGGGGGNGGGGGGGGGGDGSWPPANVRAEFSIGGLEQPPNTSVKTYYYTGANQINIAFTSTNYDAVQTYFNNWFTSNGWTVFGTTPGMGIWVKGGVSPMAIHNYDDDDDLAVLSVSK